ncbi:MAG TPA: hypothetical protein VNL91_04180 [Thermoanaerobaculia bacterium]|nr:hypothetical protein [Thermoanaerobaculia bacterium]
MEEAQRLARIAKFEFEQSPAFKAQRAEIEAAKAEAERTKKALDEERKKLVEQKKAQEEAERQKRLETEQSIEESTKQSVLTLRSSAEASAKKIEDATERAATLIKRRSDEIAADFDAKVKALGDLYTVFGQKLSTLFGVLTGALGGREGALGRDPREYAFLEDVIRKTIEQILLFGGANTRGLDPDTFRRLFEDYLKRQQKKSGNTSSQPKPSTSLTQQSTQGFLG